MDSQQILVMLLVLIPPSVRSQQSQGRWRTDGHSYSLRDKLLFGRGGSGAGAGVGAGSMQRRVVSNTRHRSSPGFVGGNKQQTFLFNHRHSVNQFKRSFNTSKTRKKRGKKSQNVFDKSVLACQVRG